MIQSNNLRLAVEAALRAGEIIKEGYRSVNVVDVKDNRSLVTEIDRNSEEAIIRHLKDGSALPILAEETHNQIRDEKEYWAIDPLDGTTNFIHRIPLFAVSIALIRDNQPVVGVVFNPIMDELYSGEVGSGVMLNGNQVQMVGESGIVFVNTGYNSEHKLKYAENVKVLSQEYSIRKFGTTALELCYVAKGSVDAFIAWGDELWDHAAGILLVREAGGVVTDWNGQDWDVSTNYVCASKNTVHGRILEKL